MVTIGILGMLTEALRKIARTPKKFSSVKEEQSNLKSADMYAGTAQQAEPPSLLVVSSQISEQINDLFLKVQVGIHSQ